MSIDVLAVLDVMHNHAAEWLDARSANGQLSNERRDHRVSLNSKARAAVAELIDAVKAQREFQTRWDAGEAIVAEGIQADRRVVAAIAACGVQA